MPVEGYAGYVAHWPQALRDSQHFLFRAATKARKAAEYLYGDGEFRTQWNRSAYLRR